MAKINYFAKKNELMTRSKKWIATLDHKYKNDIENAIQNTIIYPKDFEIDYVEPRVDKCKITFLKKDSVSAIFDVGETPDKACVLNFASYKNPGGKFTEGSSAQEECLCHESFLYNVLRAFENDFYKPNRKNSNKALYNDNLLYSKFVYFFKETGVIPCDVITCAAPNKKAAMKYHNIDSDTVNNAMMSRLYHIFQAAYNQKVDILILGAYGCGVFGNNVTDIANMMYILLNSTYKDCFKEVVFAIPQCNEYDNTFEIFKNAYYKYNLHERMN